MASSLEFGSQDAGALSSFVKDNLSKQETLEYYQTFFNNTTEVAGNKVPAKRIGAFILRCNVDVLAEKMVINRTFWDGFKNVIHDLSPNMFSKCLIMIFSSVLDQGRTSEKVLDALCEHILSDNIIIEAIATYLGTNNMDTDVNVSFIICVSQLQNCLVMVSKCHPLKAATFIPLYKLISIECKLFYVMTPHLAQKPIQDIIIDTFLPVRNELYDYLKAVTVSDYPTPLKRRFNNAVHHTFILSFTPKITFEQADKMHREFLKLNMLQASDITAFLENPNLSFKKTFTEQLVFNGRPFPLFKGAAHVSLCLNELFDTFQKDIVEKPHFAGFILNKNLFMYALMDRLLKSWVESKSEADEDIESLLQLVPINLKNMTDSMVENINLPFEQVVTMALNTIGSVDYHSARQLQLDSLRDGYYKKWSKHLSEFEIMLSDQVKDYVLHQRLLQLQKGTWVYAQNPVDPSIKAPSLYFMILSADQNNLLVREFPKIAESTPTAEGSVIVSSNGKDAEKGKTLVIPMSNIMRFEVQEVAALDKTPKDSHLISCVQKNVYTEVKFLDKGTKTLLRVYFDTKEAIYIWLDGLQLISTARHRDGITEETKEQMETLVDIRRTVQMMNLNIKEAFEAPDTSSSDEDFYNIETLKGLTSDFYYEQDMEK